MLTDPQVITLNTVAKTLPRIKSDGTSSLYQLSDETLKLLVSHQLSKQRIRSMSRVDQRAIVADPITAVNDWETLTVYTVIERPQVGFALAAVQQLVAAHQAWLTASIVEGMYGNQS